jgi:hypothetical protein
MHRTAHGAFKAFRRLLNREKFSSSETIKEELAELAYEIRELDEDGIYIKIVEKYGY